jgi:hypothetical protein
MLVLVLAIILMKKGENINSLTVKINGKLYFNKRLLYVSGVFINQYLEVR